MSTIKTYIKETQIEDAEGNITLSTITETSKIEKNEEPDYIKIYTAMWCEFNQIPQRAQKLFFELATRMTYADASSQQGGQTVFTGKPISDDICKRLGIGNDMYNKLLKDLVNCHAIQRIGRGVYQISPKYAGRGFWKYNPKYKNGGIENLIAKFDFATKQVETEVIWADDGSDTPFDTMYRQGLGVSKGTGATLTHQEIKTKEKEVV